MMKEVDRYELIFSGSGGQGIILTAIIFAEAAGVHDDFLSASHRATGLRPGGGTARQR